MVYYQNGVSGLELDQRQIKGFYIQEQQEKYTFYGDEIFHRLHKQCDALGKVFQEMLFVDENYEEQFSQIPSFVYEGGISSRYQLTKEQFELNFHQLSIQCQQTGICLAKHLYLADLQTLIGSLQNNIQIINSQLPLFYRELSKVTGADIEGDQVIYRSGGETTVVLAILNSIIITFCSILDMLSKLAYEYEHLITRFDQQMEKLKANKVAFNDVRLIKINQEDTIFDHDCRIKEIISLRNEIVHNNCWEHEPKVYIRIQQGEIKERYIYMPDTERGKLIVSKNRKRFFAQQRKINEELPNMTFHFLEKIQGTLLRIIDHSNSKKNHNETL